MNIIFAYEHKPSRIINEKYLQSIIYIQLQNMFDIKNFFYNHQQSTYLLSFYLFNPFLTSGSANAKPT
jgi:hypothetical protein